MLNDDFYELLRLSTNKRLFSVENYIKDRLECIRNSQSFENCCGHIAVRFKYAAILNDNNFVTYIGGTPVCTQYPEYEHYTKVTRAFGSAITLKDHGTLFVIAPFRVQEELSCIKQVKNAVDIQGSLYHLVILKSDGTVECIDRLDSFEGDEGFADLVSDWSDIRQIQCGNHVVVGVKSDGSLISVGKDYRCPEWTDIKEISVCQYENRFRKKTGEFFTMALLNDGSVVSDFNPVVSEWKDVVHVSAGGRGNAVGLKKDGTAYAIGHHEFIKTVESWQGIVDIECYCDKVVAILANGDVVTNYGFLPNSGVIHPKDRKPIQDQH